MVSQCQIEKSYVTDTKTCQKPCEDDLEVKVQGRIWMMNVRDTFFYGDTPMCQIWLANVKTKKDMNLHRQTDRRTKWFLYTPLNFFHVEHNKSLNGMNNACMFQEISLDMWINFTKTTMVKKCPIFFYDIINKSYITIKWKYFHQICITGL